MHDSEAIREPGRSPVAWPNRRGGSLIHPFFLLAAVIWVASFAVAAGWLARQRDRLVPLWAIYGAVLGPVALLLLWVAPHGYCRTCHMPTQGWMTTCRWCHENVNTLPSTARRATQRMEPQASPGRQLLTAVRSSRAPTTPAVSSSGPAAPNPMPRPTQPARPDAPMPTGRIAVVPQTGAAGGDGGGPDRDTKVLATATYVTGTAPLEPGQRYGIALRGSRLLVVGPVDRDSSQVVVDRPVADIQLSVIGGRLVISEQARSGVVLAFMSVAGGAFDDLAGAIRSAARTAWP